MMKKGETYCCTDEDCGCEITVTKGAHGEEGGDDNPRCCCGQEMELAMQSGQKQRAGERRAQGEGRSHSPSRH